jgi:hypothetical protein
LLFFPGVCLAVFSASTGIAQGLPDRSPHRKLAEAYYIYYSKYLLDASPFMKIFANFIRQFQD